MYLCMWYDTENKVHDRDRDRARLGLNNEPPCAHSSSNHPKNGMFFNIIFQYSSDSLHHALTDVMEYDFALGLCLQKPQLAIYALRHR